MKLDIFLGQMTRLLKDLEKRPTPTIVLGDFNEDISKKESPLLHLMASFHYQQVVKMPTTDQGSLLDHIYIKDVKTEKLVSTMDTYFSDHDAVFLTLF